MGGLCAERPPDALDQPLLLEQEHLEATETLMILGTGGNDLLDFSALSAADLTAAGLSEDGEGGSLLQVSTVSRPMKESTE